MVVNIAVTCVLLSGSIKKLLFSFKDKVRLKPFTQFDKHLCRISFILIRLTDKKKPVSDISGVHT